MRASDVVTGAAVCSEGTDRVAGSGVWTTLTVTRLTGSALASLVAALRVPRRGQPPGTACGGVGHVVPVWALTFTDGRHVQPQIPGDGCEQSEEVLRQLNAAVGGSGAIVTRVRQVQSEARAACFRLLRRDEVHRDRSAPLRGGGAPSTGPSWHRHRVQLTMTDGSGIESSGGTRLAPLVAFGSAPAVAAAVDRVYQTFTPGYPSGCNTDRPTAVLTVQAPATGSGSAQGPQTYFEVGGCNLVGATRGIRIIGSADPQAVAALNALAINAAAPTLG